MPLRIREFDPEKEDWRDYIEQVEQYFVAHDLNEDAKEPTKRALFRSRFHYIRHPEESAHASQASRQNV